MLSALISLLIDGELAAAGAEATAAATESADKAATGGGLSMLLWIVAIFAIMYFLMIRPQQKQQKKIKQMREALKEGDTVVTAGGVYGKIASVKENAFIIQIADGVKIKVDKGSVYVSPEEANAAAAQK